MLTQQGRPVEGEAADPEVDRPLYLQLLRAGGMVRRERELLGVWDLLLNIVELPRYELQLLVDAACFLVQVLAAGAWTALIALELGSLAGRARDGASLPGNVLISDSDAEVCHVGRNASGGKGESQVVAAYDAHAVTKTASALPSTQRKQSHAYER